MSASIGERRYRLIFVLAGVLLPAWWVVLRLAVPDLHDSIAIRLVIGVACLAIAGGSIVSRAVARQMPLLLFAFNCFAVGHLVVVLNANNSHPVYVISLLFGVFALAISFDKRAMLLAFFACVLLMSLAIDADVAQVAPWFIRAAILTSELAAYAAFADKLKLIESHGNANSALRLALERLSQSEQALNEAQSLAKVGSYDTDVRTKRSVWSKQAAINFGLEDGGIFDSGHSTKLIHEDDRNRVRDEWRASVNEKSIFNSRYRITRPSGEIAFIHGMGRPIFDEKGELVRMIGTVHDVTEQALAGDLIKLQQVKLIQTEKMSALGEMAGGVAHEINNPLMVIKTHADYLAILARKGKTVASADVEAITAKINFTVDRIAKIIRGLRAFARDTGNDPFQVSQVERIIRDTLDFCETRIKNNGIDLIVDAIDPGMTVECRSVQIEQIILNILNNAFDVVSGRHEEQAWIRISAQDLGEGVRIEVANGGPAVPSELKQRIFQPFFTTKAIGRGTGLGLSIARGIASAHGGHLDLEEPRRHTTFSLTLPKKQGEAAKSQSAPA